MGIWDFGGQTDLETASRRMVLVNLFAGKEWRHRGREWTCEQWGKERVVENGLVNSGGRSE